jgi:hypothetical protein
MSDPTRIREAGSDVPDELRELFRSAVKPEPLTPGAQAILARRVAAIDAGPTPGFFRWLPWLLIGGTVALAGTTAMRSRARAPRPSTVRPPPVVAPRAESPSAPPPGRPEAPARAAVARPLVSATPGDGEDALVGEARLLNEAHRALAADARRALALAHEHARRYPRGQLTAERELIEIQALVKLGRRRDAETRAETLRKTTPNSIYDERLDQILRRE